MRPSPQNKHAMITRRFKALLISDVPSGMENQPFQRSLDLLADLRLAHLHCKAVIMSDNKARSNLFCSGSHIFKAQARLLDR